MEHFKIIEKIIHINSHLPALDKQSMAECQKVMDNLLKPIGSLGEIERIALQLSGIQKKTIPTLQRPYLLVMAGDHGVCKEGVAAAPQTVTSMMASVIARGKSGASVMARHLGIETEVYDIGINAPESPDSVIDKNLKRRAWHRIASGDDKITRSCNQSLMNDNPNNSRRQAHDSEIITTNKPKSSCDSTDDFYNEQNFGTNNEKSFGTNNLRLMEAMSLTETADAINLGMEIAREKIENGADCILLGEMGIGNTTPSAAIFAMLSGIEASEIVGVGANLPLDKLPVKVLVVSESVDRATQKLESCADLLKEIRKNVLNSEFMFSPEVAKLVLEVLAELGGFEIAALLGVVLESARLGVCVIVDGFISMAVVLMAKLIAPRSGDFLIASHLSAEKGGALASRLTGLKPCLNMEFRLGEGSGAVMMYSVIKCGLTMFEMDSFADIGIEAV